MTWKPKPERVAVTELREGDMVDLEGDEYADQCDEHDCGGECQWLRYEYATVIGTERETDACLRVDFDGLSVGFPPDHEVVRTGNIEEMKQ